MVSLLGIDKVLPRSEGLIHVRVVLGGYCRCTVERPTLLSIMFTPVKDARVGW